jgi:hypothetical protein
MSRRILITLLFVIGIAPAARAQDITSVTGTVTDPRGYAYSGGQVRFTLYPPGVQSPYVTDTKSPVQMTYGPVGMSATGSFQMDLPANNAITPSGTEWSITVCSQGGAANVQPPVGSGSQCFTITASISGTSQDVSTALDAAAPVLAFPCLPTCNHSLGIDTGCVNSPQFACGSPPTTTGALVQLPTSTFNCGSGQYSIVNSQLVCTMPLTSLTQGMTVQGAFIAQPSMYVLRGPPFVGNSSVVANSAPFYPADSAAGSSISATWPNAYETSGTTDDTMMVIWEAQNPGPMDPCLAGGTVTDNKGDIYNTTPETSSGFGDICLAYSFNVPVGVTKVTLTGGPGGWTNAEIYMLEVVGPTSFDIFGNYGNKNQSSPQPVSVTTTASNDFVVEGSDNSIADDLLQCWPTGLQQGNLLPFALLDNPCMGSVAKNLFTTNAIEVGQLGAAGTYTQYTAWQNYNRNGFFVAAFKAAGSATEAIPYWQPQNPSLSSPNTVPLWVPIVGAFSNCSGTQYLGADGFCHNGLIGQTTVAGPTASISSGACATTITTAVTGTATGMTIIATPNADAAAANYSSLVVYWYPTAGNVNLEVCNPSGAPVTPSALTFNVRVEQ